MKRLRAETGSALLEAAVTIPILLLISVGIFEFGRAYQTWQILTNAAREGARVAVVPYPAAGAVEARVREYMVGGQLPRAADAAITVNRAATLTINGKAVTASAVSIDYPFDFVVLQPVARLVSPGARTGNSVTMHASSVMRNEAQ
jgi:Flp pilus assembly protein TadG